MVLPTEPLTTEDVARHYDQLDRFYREVWGDHVHHGYWATGRETRAEATRAMVDEVIKRAQIHPGMRVLDVGCGYGATARVIVEECSAEVTGLTISPAQHRYAQAANGGDRLRFLEEDWLRNAQETESCDVVIAIESTEHMPDKELAIREMARVLKPGGRAVVVAWVAAEHRTRWQDAHLVRPICREGRLAGVGTPTEYVGWIATAGLNLEEQADISEAVSRTWPWLAVAFLRAVLARPGVLRVLLDREHDNRLFALTMLRIWLAYRLGAMKMMIICASKPEK